jgi:hypothetical protein
VGDPELKPSLETGYSNACHGFYQFLWVHASIFPSVSQNNGMTNFLAINTPAEKFSSQTFYSSVDLHCNNQQI